jgi:MFS family permease
MAVAGSLAVACAASVIGGTGNGIQWISVVTALQEATPTAYQARVTGFLESLGAAMPGVGYLLGGVIVAVSSPRTAYAAAGIAIMCLVAGALFVRARAERRAPIATFQPDPQTDPGG